MAAHSSIFPGEVPWTEEPGGPQSMGSKVRHNLVTKQQDSERESVSCSVVSDSL